ncbi:MAG: hypothetical protein IKP73_00640 [Bacteroidales bacterium]|jgi:hypothetical protein|nr:hypothetical protein [Bacteroidales bacterium]
MESLKTQFQADLTAIEGLLAQLKNSYPQNIGTPFRRCLPYFLMLLSICMIIDAFSGDEVISKLPCCISPVLLFFAIVLWNKMYGGPGSSSQDTSFNADELHEKISYVETKYAEYPDVNSFVQQFKAAVAFEQKRKRKISLIFWLCFCGFFVLYGVKIYYDFSKSSDKGLRNISTSDNYYRVLNLEDKVPFLQIKPLKTDIADGIRLESDHIDVYLHYYWGEEIVVEKDTSHDRRALRILTPKIAGSKFSDKYRITITDETGKPISGCPDFVFVEEDDRQIICSSDFSFYAYSDKYQFQALYTLKYLQDHQEHLRFLVEKLN